MNRVISWLHLSDIHVGHGSAAHKWNQRDVLAAILKDLRSLKEAWGPCFPQPDLVLITGDIAYSGGVEDHDEYKMADQWLREVLEFLDLGPASVFMVPGNHDVQRKVDEDDPATARLVRLLRLNQEQLDEALEVEADFESLRKRQANYLSFAREYQPVLGNLFWRADVDGAQGREVRIVGLNTAILAADSADRLHLRVGNRQLSEGLHDCDERLVVVLGHHPLSWLGDHQDVGARIVNGAHVHLHGHVHTAMTNRSRAGTGRNFVEVSAGAVHLDESEVSSGIVGHGYSIGEVLEGDGGRTFLRVFPRRWSRENHDFRRDVELVDWDQPYALHELGWRAGVDEPGSDGSCFSLGGGSALREEILSLRGQLARLTAGEGDSQQRVAKVLESLQSELAFAGVNKAEAWATVVEAQVGDDLGTARELATSVAARLSTHLGHPEAEDKTEFVNCVRWLTGMIAAGGELANIAWKTVHEDLALNVNAALPISVMLKADLSQLDDVNAAERLRLIGHLCQALKYSHVRLMLRSLRDRDKLSIEEIERVSTAATDIFKGPKHLEAVVELRWQEVDEVYFNDLVQRTASGTWDTANSAISAIQEMSVKGAERMASVQRATYLLNVAGNTLGEYAPFSARALLRDGLGERASFLDDLETYIANVEDGVLRNYASAWSPLARLAQLHDRWDVVQELVRRISDSESLKELSFELRRRLRNLDADEAMVSMLENDSELQEAAGDER